jgi:DNA mismatch repair protein MSH5
MFKFIVQFRYRGNVMPYSNLISTHELGQLLDEEMTEEERSDLEASEAICRRFLSWDMDAEGGGDEAELDVKRKLVEVLGREAMQE